MGILLPREERTGGLAWVRGPKGSVAGGTSDQGGWVPTVPVPEPTSSCALGLAKRDPLPLPQPSNWSRRCDEVYILCSQANVDLFSLGCVARRTKRKNLGEVDSCGHISVMYLGPIILMVCVRHECMI